ncbi:MAG: hypothetical protein VYE46_03175 [Cyanobacteriota bacterium]|nr:hypothetical protein [Cyanobacteriota bacterium]
MRGRDRRGRPEGSHHRDGPMPVPPKAGSAAGDLERAHGRTADSPPLRTDLRTSLVRSAAITAKTGRFDSSLDRQSRER